MGRIHRYGQEKDCLILNFVSTNTREGRVLQKLFERLKQIEEDLDPQQTGKVFNVLGDVFPANQLEKHVPRDVRPQPDRRGHQGPHRRGGGRRSGSAQITDSTLEGLAKRELNLSAIVGKSAEAKERRLVPEVIEDFFVQAGPARRRSAQGSRSRQRTSTASAASRARSGRSASGWSRASASWAASTGRSSSTRPCCQGRHARNGSRPGIRSSRPCARTSSTGSATTCGAARSSTTCTATTPCRLDVFAASVKDGRGNASTAGSSSCRSAWTAAWRSRQPTVFLDLAPAPEGTAVPDGDASARPAGGRTGPGRTGPQPFLAEVAAERQRETETIPGTWRSASTTLIHRQNLRMAELFEQQPRRNRQPGSTANIEADRGPAGRTERPAGAPPRRAAAGAAVHHRRHPAHRPGLGPAAPRAHLAGHRPDGPRRGDRARSPWPRPSPTKRPGAGGSRASRPRTAAST